MGNEDDKRRQALEEVQPRISFLDCLAYPPLEKYYTTIRSLTVAIHGTYSMVWKETSQMALT